VQVTPFGPELQPGLVEVSGKVCGVPVVLPAAVWSSVNVIDCVPLPTVWRARLDGPVDFGMVMENEARA
jgi:hypothetical protein